MGFEVFGFFILGEQTSITVEGPLRWKDDTKCKQLFKGHFLKVCLKNRCFLEKLYLNKEKSWKTNSFRSKFYQVSLFIQ